MNLNPFKKKKENNINSQLFKAICINQIGFINHRTFSIIDSNKSEVTVLFNNGKKAIFDKNKIRGSIVMFEKPDGNFRIIDPEMWKNIPLENYDIKEFRFNLQNTRIQESKAAISRWTLPKSNLDKLLPLFKFLVISISVGIVGWAMLKYGTVIFNSIISASNVPCDSILPKAPIPVDAIGYVANSTAVPIG